ncbi:Hypothetical Protein FCC1311_010742 [Hondaea fermentalgiana]|uniref:Uncharacterized protein n=1 Tax=Hondaea fermentalgiana TaxID=2315210 RepID=A0A2R5G1F2_9STRA|nr:Hypothetical Protein FCC1311_010742 [Hondaea fermentalgiana]|eukprot:GBG24856.1 Hypothetical Protein FCC1311_010742 [Hondaea fermentalgiana]
MAVPVSALAVAEAGVVAISAVLAHWLGEFEEFEEFHALSEVDDLDDEEGDAGDDNGDGDEHENGATTQGKDGQEREAKGTEDTPRKGPSLRERQRAERFELRKQECKWLETEMTEAAAAADAPAARKKRLEKVKDEIIGSRTLTREDQRVMLRKLMLIYLEKDEPELRGCNLTDVRARHPYPAWIPDMGGFPHLLGGTVILAALIALTWVSYYRPRNLFEIAGVPPFTLQDPRFGSFMLIAKRRGVDPAFGLSDVAEKELFAKLRDGNFRESYDMFGQAQGNVSSLWALLGLLSSVFGFYAVHVWVLVLASTLSRRLHAGLRSGLTALGVLLFVDGRAVIGYGAPVHSYDYVNQAPVLCWLTSWEKMWVFRCVLVPLVVAGCLMYASFTFEDMEERSLQNILNLLLDSTETEQYLFRAIEHCQQRREKRDEVQTTVQQARAQGAKSRFPSKSSKTSA